MRSATAAGLALVLAAGAHAKVRSGVDREPLVTVSEPTGTEPAAAHPHVNVTVGFGVTTTGVGADPASFRAKLNGRKVTDLFEPVASGGAVVGARARIPPTLLRVGRGGKNALRVSIRSLHVAGTPLLRDADRVSFRAVSVPNGDPVARFSVQPDVLLPGVPLQFDATTSEDPDRDDLTYRWDFGDGATADGATAAHAYADAGADRTVTLTVGDGQAAVQASVTLHAAPTCDPAALPGTLRIDADEALELGPVAVGATTTRTFVVRNTDATPGTQVKATVASDAAAFAVSPTDLTLGAGESMPVTVTFAPTTAGHQSARIAIAACATDQNGVALLAHGFGGAAPGNGPTLAASPAFHLGVVQNRIALFETRPDGTRLPVALDLPWCADAGGNGTHDLCTRSADCATSGETCVALNQQTFAVLR